MHTETLDLAEDVACVLQARLAAPQDLMHSRITSCVRTTRRYAFISSIVAVAGSQSHSGCVSSLMTRMARKPATTWLLWNESDCDPAHLLALAWWCQDPFECFFLRLGLETVAVVYPYSTAMTTVNKCSKYIVDVTGSSFLVVLGFA